MNRVDLIGTILTEPRMGRRGKESCASFLLEVRGKDGVDVIPCLAKNGTAAGLCQRCKKGGRLGICGRLHTGRLTEGVDAPTWEVEVYAIYQLDKATETPPSPQEALDRILDEEPTKKEE